MANEYSTTYLWGRAKSLELGKIKNISRGLGLGLSGAKNSFAICLLETAWIRDKRVVAVTPQPELKPFFDFNHEAMEERLSQSFGKWRPRGDSNPRSPP